MINGRSFDWESIKIHTPWGLNFCILNINYKSERPAEPTYGRGNVPRGYGRGNLTQEGGIEIDAQSWAQLQVYAATQAGLFRIKPFVISVSYGNDDQIPQVDTLPSCIFTTTETEATQGDTEIGKRTLAIQILDPISYNLVSVM